MTSAAIREDGTIRPGGHYPFCATMPDAEVFACIAEYTVLAADPTIDFEPGDRALLIVSARLLAGELQRRLANLHRGLPDYGWNR